MKEYKHIPEPFEEIEDKLQMLDNFSFEGIMFYRKGALIFVNEAVLRLTGLTREEITEGKRIEHTIPHKHERSLFQESITTQRDPFEIELERKDGSLIAVEMESHKVLCGKEVINIVSVRDISGRRSVEDEISKLTVAVDQSANIIIITRTDGEIEYVNRSFTKVTGYSPDEVIGKNPRILKSGIQTSSFYQDLWQTLKKGEQWTGEFQNRKKNGEIYWEYATITPVKNKNGDIVRYIAIKEDITKQKKAEQSLRESEEQYKSMVSNIPGVLYRCALDHSRTIFYITDAVETLSGYKANVFLFNAGRSYASIIHPEDLERVLSTIHSGLLKTKQYTVEYRILTADHKVKWVSDSGKPVYDQNQNVKWLDGFIFDISERINVLEELKKAKQLAEEANKAKSEFLANISHEIRTPLNTVLGFAELLENMTLDETQLKYLNSIKSSGENLMTLINDLLDLSKIEAGKVNLHYTSVKVRDMLDEIRNIFFLKANQKGIAYHEHIDADFPAEIIFDETRLRQILINLVGNAIKFTHEGHVDLLVKARTKRVQGNRALMKLEISIMDTGIGIPEDSYQVIFDSFRQQLKLDARKYEGTGLGLAITKRFVEAMNGKIFLESEVGKGTTFTIVFPGVEYIKEPLKQTVFEPGSKKSGKIPRTVAAYNPGSPVHERKKDDQKPVSIMSHDEFISLLDKFENKMYRQWKQFESKKPLKEIKFFAQDVVRLGKKFKVKYVQEYGEQLYLTIENFDIEEMQLKLEEFPGLLDKLKKIPHETRM
ncbi:MAG: PAS domain S-box protein [Bacteroidales bacterium]|nr:PAS domain S-box protein [Bacteroidales bacterium]